MAIMKLSGRRQGKLRTSASRGRNRDLSTVAWARCVEMIAAKNGRAKRNSQRKRPEVPR